jgi:hypothetical protein
MWRTVKPASLIRVHSKLGLLLIDVAVELVLGKRAFGISEFDEIVLIFWACVTVVYECAACEGILLVEMARFRQCLYLLHTASLI